MKIRSLLLAAAVMPVCALAHEGTHAFAHAAPAAPSAVAPPATLAPLDGDGSARAEARDRAARIFFSDRRLLTQRGEEVRFYSDVLRNHVVLINFVFTQCADTCPTQTARVAAVQTLLDGKDLRDVRLVSISVDPRNDTPAALAQYASTFGAGAQWTFLTGRADDIGDVLRRLGQWTEDPRSHTTLFIAGNAATGHWMKLHPDLSPASIAAELRALAAETTQSTGAHVTGSALHPPATSVPSTNASSH